MESKKIEPLLLRSNFELEKLFRSSRLPKEIVGTSHLSHLALLLLQPISQTEPHLIVVPLDDDAAQLQRALHFFDPYARVSILPAFDVDPYSNLYPNRRNVSERLGWMHRASRASGGEIFIASIPALLQFTLPFEELELRTTQIKTGQTLSPQFFKDLSESGYVQAPIVEDVGSFSQRGGIVDIFSPAHDYPVRLELFGDVIDTMRFFDPATQRSLDNCSFLQIIPAQEVLFSDDSRARAAQLFRKSIEGRNILKEDAQQTVTSISQGHYFQGLEFLSSYFYEQPGLALDAFQTQPQIWLYDPSQLPRSADELWANFKKQYDDTEASLIHLKPSELIATWDSISESRFKEAIHVSKVQIFHDVPTDEESEEAAGAIEFRSSPLRDFSQQAKALQAHPDDLHKYLQERLGGWKSHGQKIFIATGSVSQSQRMQVTLEKSGMTSQVVDENDHLWSQWTEEQERDPTLIHLIPHVLPESFYLKDEGFVFLRDEDFFGHKKVRREYKETGTLENRAHALSFGDLKPGDFIVHKIHGVGVYEGLKVMPIQDIAAEFIQIKYKDQDRLYLPVYRIHQIQKYSGPASPTLIDRLGGTSWEKTKTKVRSHLRDMAAELLNLYAKRADMNRPVFSPPDEDFNSFESSFLYEETPDQNKAISDILKDLTTNVKPMDRLICGDVGFGKTEIAMRAAFKCVQEGKQVGIIAPTTILTFQHLETFKKRFKKWPVEIRAINRFVEKKDQTKTLKELKEGKVDILIGTHRLFSKDVLFKDLGLLIIDEEQKFGVKHKERLRKLKASVDTLALSATPIPRTLNLSLVGIRDLSIINTAPVDRLPTRTFVCKFDKETIRKAITSEIARGGQVYFIHNRIQSIYALADQLREILPDVKFKVAHGQMEEHELESAMLAFFNHEIDMLLCTAIVESGMDVPRANTMFIDNAQIFGLSQLYQLRGRVGRSKERAYCYLLVPPNQKLDDIAQERLKVLQENTALGSGIRIAHYDLELRGAGDILGEEQSGHIQSVGYELYIELLEEAVSNAKGEEPKNQDIEPDINVRIPALIPDAYMPDLRVRLAYYKALSEIETTDDIHRIEDELRDQFGKPPEQVINLMGLMLIRKYCRDLGIKDLSSGKVGVTLMFTEHTPLSTQKVVELTARANKKYSITPDNRLTIRINEITWPRITEELVYLLTLC